MKELYYIAEVQEETCILKNMTKETKVISMFDLADFSKQYTVVGYNAITGKVSVKTKEDALGYFKSKLKLSGVPLDNFGFDLGIIHLDGVCEVIESENRVVLTVSDKTYGYKMNSIFRTVRVDWCKGLGCSESLRNLVNNRYTHLDIILDLEDYECIEGTTGTIYPALEYNNIHLNSIKIVNKNMFKSATRVIDLFDFSELLGEPNINSSFDFSDLVFNEKVVNNIVKPFGNLRNVQLPELLYQKAYGLGLIRKCSYDTEMFKKVISAIPCNRLEYTFDDVTIDRLKYSELFENRLLEVAKVKYYILDKYTKGMELTDVIVNVERIVITYSIKEIISDSAYNSIRDLLKYVTIRHTDDSNIREIIDIHFSEVSFYDNAKFMHESAMERIEEILTLSDKDREILSKKLHEYFAMSMGIKIGLSVLGDLNIPTKFTKSVLTVYSSLDEQETMVWLFILYLMTNCTTHIFKLYSMEDLKRHFTLYDEYDWS